MRGFLSLTLTIVLTAAGVSGVYASSGISTMNSSLIEKPAPDFTLDTLSQKAVKMSQYREGSNAIIFFWATWCPHCRVQLKELNERRDELASEGIKLIIVDLGEDPGTVQSYVNKNGIQLEIFLDERSSLSDSYRLVGVPTFYFLDSKGVIKLIQHSLPEDYKAVFAGK